MLVVVFWCSVYTYIFVIVDKQLCIVVLGDSFSAMFNVFKDTAHMDSRLLIYLEWGDTMVHFLCFVCAGKKS